MEKLAVREVVIVEGKYDKIKLSSLIDGLIIPLDGFRIYKDKEKTAMLRAIAQKQGAVIVTDSDRAGFQLRNYLKSLLAGAKVSHVYIPQIAGKERRKATPGKEGLLGVEGIDAATLRQAFLRAGIGSDQPGIQPDEPITRMDFFDAGLMGGQDSAKKRRELQKKLALPGYLSGNSLLQCINSLMTRAEFLEYAAKNKPE